MTTQMKLTGKKSPTNQSKKEQHQNRKIKKAILNHIDDYEWTRQLKEYNATQSL